MRDPKKFALASASHWLNRCYNLGFTVEDVVAYSVSKCDVSKRVAFEHSAFEHSAFKPIENESEKETFPPAPPIEKKGKQETTPTLTPVSEFLSQPRARTCEGAGACTHEGGAVPKVSTAEVLAFFNEFWSLYPVGFKTGKKMCFIKLAAKYRDAKDRATFRILVLEGLKRWKPCERWVDGYVCNPETFINQERWNDEPPPPRNRKAEVYISSSANVHSKKVGAW